MINAGFDQLLSTLGYIAVGLFVGVESLGVPLPGETMLITAAVFAGATHRLSIAGVVIAAVCGAVLGDNAGFGIGWYGGYPLLRRFGRYVRLDEPKLKVGRYIFARHGGKVVFFGRFVSILRTYAAFLAGVNRMDWRHFLIANATGGVLWAVLYGVGAYVLGSQIDRASRPLEIVFGVAGGLAVVASLLVLRSRFKKLEEVAERAHPGPLEGFSA